MQTFTTILKWTGIVILSLFAPLNGMLAASMMLDDE